MAAGKGRTVSELPDGPPDASGLTRRQQRVLEVIRESIELRGYPPSMREIGERVGLTSSSSVAHQLRTLEEKGYIKRDPHRPRALSVYDPDLGECDETGVELLHKGELKRVEYRHIERAVMEIEFKQPPVEELARLTRKAPKEEPR